MGKTIIQTIGPLYGEVANGTVFGRPNGSIYVPSQNTITASIKASTLYIRNYPNPAGLLLCNSAGNVDWQAMSIVAQSQDAANYIVTEVSETSDFSGTIYKRQYVAGRFNVTEALIAVTSALTIVAGTTYYVRARLMSASNVAVSTSDVIAVEGVEI